MPFRFQPDSGTIHDGDVRYLMIRPDVLMNSARQLGSVAAFVEALEVSAFENARSSFEGYAARGLMTADDCLVQIGKFAGQLGWGEWKVTADGTEVQVRDSPFAQGFGIGEAPVCGPIVGVLRALLLVMLGDSALVREEECACQGVSHCRFVIRR